jgi:group I intron endonuclease
MIGIYKITNPKKRIYIGKSIDVKNRWCLYKRFACKKQIRLYNSLKKYGYDKHKFEIIHPCLESELNELEQYYIQLYNTFNSEFGLNLRSGGEGGRHSEESKIKMSILRRNRPPMSEEQKQKISIAHIGMKTSEETKKKMSDSKIGKSWKSHSRFDLEKIRELYKQGVSQSKLAKMVNTDKGTISRIVNKVNYK